MKQAIIFANFGIIDAEVRNKTVGATVDELRKNFPEFEIRQAVTSNFIRKKINALSIEEQIKNLREENFQRIIILPSHFTQGEEFENKILPNKSADVEIINPLFTPNCDTEFDRKIFEIVLDCFKISNDENLILVGHGSPHRHNPVYENLQKIAGEKIHIGVIESNDTPNFEDVLNRLKKNHAEKISIAPLLFSGGSHLKNDIDGDKNSWRTKLEEKNFVVRVCSEGLGSFSAFRNIYVEKIKRGDFFVD